MSRQATVNTYHSLHALVPYLFLVHPYSAPTVQPVVHSSVREQTRGTDREGSSKLESSGPASNIRDRQTRRAKDSQTSDIGSKEQQPCRDFAPPSLTKHLFQTPRTIIAVVRLAFSYTDSWCRLPHPCVVYWFYFGFLLAMVIFLRTDGRLLALCDHGNWPCLLDQYGQREYWVERPGWFLNVKTTKTQQNKPCS